MQNTRSAAFLAIVSLLTSAASADEIRQERVQFDRGENSATIEASITGYDTVDYVLGATRGQQMTVSMATDNQASYFNIMAPGEDDVAMFIGSIKSRKFRGTLPESGDYRVRVYLMRAAARRDETASYQIDISITGDTRIQDAADAKVEGTDFHAVGEIPCTIVAGGQRYACRFGVVRKGDGNGVVTITKPDGRTRSVFFEDGEAASADVSEADPGAFGAHRHEDSTLVSIGDERYEIPDAIIWGG